MSAQPISTSSPSNATPAGRLTAVGRVVRPWLGTAAGVIGLATALVTALGPLRVDPARRTDSIAVVDGRSIPRATYERAIAALESDKRNPLTTADRRLALTRLIDEELMTRRALDLGLAENEPSVRKALVDALIQLASVPEARSDPAEDELRHFYEGRPTLLSGEPLLTVAIAGFAATDTVLASRMASLLRAGVPFDKAAAEAGAQPAATPPELVSPRKLADYAGPTIADTARRLATGEVAGPIEAAGRSVFVLVRARQEAPPPPFDMVREQVLEAWRRSAHDRALESYLAGLRSRAHITFASDAPR